eukprot:TRINITY_DN6582_c0_g1_i2.p1 TRINITY_DN6582_c0_g1~~TRINITY_DN6582_c0_g1_i2.p1  ORF type:complete len:290 (-),score=30.77 TRINITY_DN6582_c0_g1_i2:109-978(-)
MEVPDPDQNQGEEGHHVQITNTVSFSGAKGNIFFEDTSGFLISIDEEDVHLISIVERRSTSLKLQYLETRGIISVKLCPEEKLLTLLYQSNPSTLTFFSIKGQQKFTQTSKRKPAKILDFFWLDASHIIIVTTVGVELYQKPTDQHSRQRLKLVKELKHNINWVVYSPFRVLLLSTNFGSQNTLQSYYFKHGTITKLPRFTVDLFSRDILQPKDIIVTQIYGRLYVIHHYASQCQMVLYQLTKEKCTKLEPINIRTLSSAFVHIVDNLLIVHDKTSKVTLVEYMYLILI